jgi:hypothetical protein
MTAITLTLPPTTTKINIKSMKQTNSKHLGRSISLSMASKAELNCHSESTDSRISEVSSASEVVFRTASSTINEKEEMWTLKRASPVFEDEGSESDDEYLESPTKRMRTSFFLPVPNDLSLDASKGQVISWEFQVRESETGFDILP